MAHSAETLNGMEKDRLRQAAEILLQARRTFEPIDELPPGLLLRLVLWLANEAQSRTGGLLAGQWITTGSWTGKNLTDSGRLRWLASLSWQRSQFVSIEPGSTEFDLTDFLRLA
jgi:hypothetical protein